MYKRENGEFATVVNATDSEFEEFVRQHDVTIGNSAEITGWSFDDRYRLLNFLLQRDGMIEFADGSRIDQNALDTQPLTTQEGEHHADTV